MKTVLLLGGPAAGQRVEVHGVMGSYIDFHSAQTYRVVPMCSHGEVHWFGVLEGADPLTAMIVENLRKGIDAEADSKCATGTEEEAAQASSGALSALWKLLGAKHQTEAVQKLERLLGGYPSDSVHTEPMGPRVYSKVPR